MGGSTLYIWRQPDPVEKIIYELLRKHLKSKIAIRCNHENFPMDQRTAWCFGFCRYSNLDSLRQSFSCSISVERRAISTSVCLNLIYPFNPISNSHRMLQGIRAVFCAVYIWNSSWVGWRPHFFASYTLHEPTRNFVLRQHLYGDFECLECLGSWQQIKMWLVMSCFNRASPSLFWSVKRCWNPWTNMVFSWCPIYWQVNHGWIGFHENP